MKQTKNIPPSQSDATTRRVQRLVRNAGRAYYFTHEIVKRYEAGEIEFVDEDGRTLTPSYFCAGLTGMNGTLKAS